MLIEAVNKVGAEKGKHSKDRKAHFSGVRVRRMDTRLGTICLYIPKLRKGGYVPFFVTERKQSEKYPFLIIDASYDKVRVEDWAMILALMIAYGVNSNGIREILAVELMFDESEVSWRAFFQKLKKRGLRRVNL